VLWREIDWILKGLFKFELNAETKYVLNILVSMIPVGIVGLFFKDYVEEIFGSGLLIVGCCLLLTALLLIFSYYARPRQRGFISMKDAFIIGLAQALAVLPGLSRSGSTIATGIILGNRKKDLAQFSFLMVLIPILGEAFLDLLKLLQGELTSELGIAPAVVGFLAAFISILRILACSFEAFLRFFADAFSILAFILAALRFALATAFSALALILASFIS
jgi:undecaprenyl-diphosphatase